MLHYVFQNYLFLFIYVIVQVSYSVSSESAREKTATFSDIEHKSTCTSEKCTCADVPQFYGLECKNTHKSPFPELIFGSAKYLPERIFLGLRIHAV